VISQPFLPYLLASTADFAKTPPFSAFWLQVKGGDVFDEFKGLNMFFSSYRCCSADEEGSADSEAFGRW